ncbi:hypothetical protein LCGC14_1703930 [marine sediment metagenome]|uniref:SF4 helicase domain-containing protein n=1 Tax=marine sediment metagenome TaxID=412755 RepID=A0A0F9HHN8_9ZZZZ
MDDGRSLVLRRHIDDYVGTMNDWFLTNNIWSQYNVVSTEGKRIVWERLEELVRKGELEKQGQRYRRRQKGRKLDSKADPLDVVVMNWPRSLDDSTDFGLDQVKIFSKAIIIVSGVSNFAKTTFCINVIAENVDNPHFKVKYMTNELADEELVDRLSPINWVDLYDEDGEYRFEAIEKFDHWDDEIEPDFINIIDYLDPGSEFYDVGNIIDKIKQRLGKGIAIIAIQKGVGKYKGKDGKDHYSIAQYGVGGQFSEHRARVVIHLDPTDDKGVVMLTIKKAKGIMSGRKYTFTVIERGSRFHDIQEVYE